MDLPTPKMLDRGDGTLLAYDLLPGRAPTIVFLPGFNSDMTGEKATALRAHCATTGHAMLRLDYSGHGASQGEFAEGSIGRWAADAKTIIDQAAPGPLILVGSSMGGWIALLLAQALAPRLQALIGIAAAPDFTESLIWDRMDLETRTRLIQDGHLLRPNQYGAPYPITLHLIEEARDHLLLPGPIEIACPVRLLQGQRDDAVPWQTALDIAEAVTSTDVHVLTIKDGDHRLSRPSDIALLCETLTRLLS